MWCVLVEIYNFQWNCAMDFTAFTIIYYTVFVVASLTFVWRRNFQSSELMCKNVTQIYIYMKPF